MLLALERDAFALWSAAIEDLRPEARRDDGWTLRDVVAHLAAWQRMAANRLEKLAIGEKVEPPDIDAFNAQVHAAAAGQSWAHVLAEASAARAAFREAVEQLPHEALAAHDGLGAFIVDANGAAHYREHQDDFAKLDP